MHDARSNETIPAVAAARGRGDASPAWIQPLCRIAQDWKIADGLVRLRQHFERASADLSDSARAVALIRCHLAEEPALAEAWQTYSYDKVSRPRPYLDDCEVGSFDGARRDVIRYDDRLDACADFIVREARSVLANASLHSAVPDAEQRAAAMVEMTASPDQDDPLLTPAEVARMLNVNPKTVARWAERGKLPALRTVGGHRRFRRSELNNALAKANSEAENT